MRVPRPPFQRPSRPDGPAQAGSTVGAGVLALPAATESSGFVASSVALTAGWGFSILTGLLIAEARIAPRRERARDMRSCPQRAPRLAPQVSYALLRKGMGGVSLLTMAQKTLGCVRSA